MSATVEGAEATVPAYLDWGARCDPAEAATQNPNSQGQQDSIGISPPVVEAARLLAKDAPLPGPRVARRLAVLLRDAGEVDRRDALNIAS